MRIVLSSFNKRWWITSAEIMQSSGSKFELDLCPKNSKGPPQIMGNSCVKYQKWSFNANHTWSTESRYNQNTP